MKSCGMYDFSGEWSYWIGLPAKSGVSGVVFLIVPRVMGIAIFSPRLDERGNTVRGVEFAKQFLKNYSVHIYDCLKGVFDPFDDKLDIWLNADEEESIFVSNLLWSISNKDNNEVERLLEEVSLNEKSHIDAIKNYDGSTPAHVACAKNNIVAF
jgi:glutaminase